MFLRRHLLYLAGCTVFAWDGKRRRPQYCLCSTTSSRLYSVCLTWPNGTVLQVRRAWQGLVLGIVVDMSTLPYLLCLLPRPTLSKCPGRSFLVGPDRVDREREASKGPAYPRSEERGQSRTTISSWLGLSVGVATRSPGRRRRLGTESWSRPIIMYLGWTRRVLLLRRLLDQVLQGSGSTEDPRFMNPTQSIRSIHKQIDMFYCKERVGHLSMSPMMSPEH